MFNAERKPLLLVEHCTTHKIWSKKSSQNQFILESKYQKLRDICLVVTYHVITSKYCELYMQALQASFWNR